MVILRQHQVGATVPDRFFRKIVAYSILGILAVGLAVVLVVIMPLYRHLQEQAEKDFLVSFSGKTAAIEQYLARGRDIARQITSRSAIRDYLEAYERGEGSLEALAAFTAPRLADAMNLSEDVYGITRFDRLGHLVVQVGQQVPEEFLKAAGQEMAEVELHGPFSMGSETTVVAVAPIRNRQGRRVGADMVLLKTTSLARIVTDPSGPGAIGEVLLGVQTDGAVRLFFPWQGDMGGVIQADSSLGVAMLRAAAGESGLLRPEHATGDIIAYGPLSVPGWSIVTRSAAVVLFALAVKALQTLCVMVGILVLIGVLGMYLLVRRVKKCLQSELQERQAAEESRRSSEERFRAIFNAANDAIFIHDLETGVILDVNQKMCDMFGLSREEALRSDVATISAGVKPYAQQDAMAWISKAAAGAPQLFEWHAKDSAGRLFWVEVNMRRATIGAVDRIIVTVRDITERKEAAEEVRQVNADLLAINRIIVACASTLDAEAILNSVMDEALRISGLEGGTICYVTAEQTLQIASHRSTSQATIEDLTTHVVKVGDCLCGECAKDHKPLILWDREAVLRFSTREATRGEDIRFHAAFPLIISQRCVGVLCVFTRTDRKPTEKSLQLLETVSTQIAMAIDNARLYRESVQHGVTLEEKVRQRMVELEAKNAELQRFNKLFVDRELKMVELKGIIRGLQAHDRVAAERDPHLG